MKSIKVDKLNSNKRIDKFVRKYLNDAPLSFIYKLFRKKDVKVNDHWVKENYILKENDEIKIYVTDNQLNDFNKPKDIEKLNANLNIIYEDDNILIINKPKGILVTGNEDEKRITLTNFVQSYLFKKNEFKNDGIDFTPSPVHRLDRNTSGIVVFAKNLLTSQLLMEEFKNHNNLDKYYLALCYGKFEKDDGIINANLLKDEEKNIVKISNKEGSKESITEYKVLDYKDGYSLALVHLLTGRTHQIRVHMSYIGHPVIGDSKYGNFKINKEFDNKYKYDSQFLHAYKLSFKNMIDNLSYLSNKSFKAKLSKKEEEILKNIGLKY